MHTVCDKYQNIIRFPIRSMIHGNELHINNVPIYKLMAFFINYLLNIVLLQANVSVSY